MWNEYKQALAVKQHLPKAVPFPAAEKHFPQANHQFLEQ